MSNNNAIEAGKVSGNFFPKFLEIFGFFSRCNFVDSAVVTYHLEWIFSSVDYLLCFDGCIAPLKKFASFL